MNETHNTLKDPRIEKILNMIAKYTADEFNFQETVSENGDEMDAIIVGLNTLSKKRVAELKHTADYQRRVEHVVDVLLKYTLFDFSEKVEVSDNGDELDAIAIGLNTLVEELQASSQLEKAQLETIKENNEQIETILNNAPNSVIVINEAGEIVKWNRKSEIIFGWDSHEVMHKPMHNYIMPSQYVGAHHQGVNHFLKTGEGPVIGKTIEITAIRKSKEEFPIELSISAVKSKGEYLFIAFIADISQRRQAENEIKSVNQHLENSVKELEAFTYSVSHDLRAPLRAIHGYMNILWNNHAALMDEKAKMMMNAIMSNSKKMGQLIDDLLALSRLGRTALQKKMIDMNTIATTVVNELEKIRTVKKPEIIFHPLPDAFADSSLITQVYTNLISNAIKYSSLKDKPVIEIGSITENGEIIYYVKDNGSGFDMQFYNKLFGVFQRLHDSNEFEGNGVGLSIVKQIILRHGGRVWATSVLEKGSTFYFTV